MTVPPAAMSAAVMAAAAAPVRGGGGRAGRAQKNKSQACGGGEARAFGNGPKRSGNYFYRNLEMGERRYYNIGI